MIGTGQGYFKLAGGFRSRQQDDSPRSLQSRDGESASAPSMPAASSAAALTPVAGAASASAALVDGTSNGSSVAVGDGSGDGGRSGAAADGVLVVAFGSAPGVPNWGGLLKRLAADLEQSLGLGFDVLYVVDGGRQWYSGMKNLF